jgi:hypothetical protein
LEDNNFYLRLQKMYEHGVRTDKKVEGNDGKTLLSDKAIFLSASEKNSSLSDLSVVNVHVDELSSA